MELEQLFMPLRHDLTTVPKGSNARPLLIGGMESFFMLIVLVFLACHQLVPHLVPNSPLVPLRNVSWGLGVCSVFVSGPFLRVGWFWRSVRSLPPPALFRPVARRLCPLFSSSCLSGLTRLRPGVCVCNI